MRKLIYRVVGGFWRLIFQVLYYPLAPFYDRISDFAFVGQWSKWQRSVLPRIQGQKVLEVGCGTGTLLATMLERGFEAYGVDASTPMLNQARKKLAKMGKTGRVLHARSQYLPFPNDSFETVVSTFPSEYITRLDTLKEITRVLYPGGRLVIVDTAILKPFNGRSRFFIKVYGWLGIWSSKTPQGISTFRLPLSEAGLVRRDETAEDEQGEAHIIIALKVW